MSKWLIFIVIIGFVSVFWVIGPRSPARSGRSTLERLGVLADHELPVAWEAWAEWITLPRRGRCRMRVFRRRRHVWRFTRPRRHHRVRRRTVPTAVPAPTNSSGAVTASASLSPAEERVPVTPETEAPGGPSVRRRGRKPTIDARRYCCPNNKCRYYRKFGPGHRIVGNGHCRHDKRHQFLKCQACGAEFCERKGTVFFNLKTDEQTIYRALTALAEGQGIRSVARTFEVDVETVRRWLRRAGQHAELVSDYLLHDLNVTEAQLDELWTFVYKKEKNLSAWEKLYTEYGDTWIWVAFDPIHKLVVAFVVGDHEQPQAETLLRRFKARLAEGLIPYLTSDELPHYAEAILKVFGRWVQPQRKGTRGRFPKPRLEPMPDLCYATVNKTRAKGRVIHIATRIIFGTAQAIWQRIQNSPVSRAINTAFVEPLRVNLTFRLFNRRLTRKTLGFSKKREWLEWHLHLTVAYYHFVLPHRSLRERLAEPIPTRGTGSPKQWRPRTPAMAAGLTDHVWTMEELLTFRVPTAV